MVGFSVATRKNREFDADTFLAMIGEGKGRFWLPKKQKKQTIFAYENGRRIAVPNNCVSGSNRGPGGKTCYLTGVQLNRSAARTKSAARRHRSPSGECADLVARGRRPKHEQF